MAEYARLVLVACFDPRSNQIALRGTERRIRVTALGASERINVDLGTRTEVRHSFQIASSGEHDLPGGHSWCRVTKHGSGSPTTVELIQDG